MLKCNPQVFCRNIVAVAPLLLEVRSLQDKTFLNLFKRSSDETVRIFDSFARLVDEICLNAVPLRAKLLDLLFRDQGLAGTAPALERNHFRFPYPFISLTRLVKVLHRNLQASNRICSEMNERLP